MFIKDVGANYIAQLRNLKVLNLSKGIFSIDNNRIIGDKGVKSIAKLANIRKLHLSSIDLMQRETQLQIRELIL